MAYYEHPEHQNILDVFAPDEDAKQSLYSLVMEEFEADSNSRTRWVEMQSDWMELYFQEHKTEMPFPGASEESIPMITEACAQFHARAYRALFPGRDLLRVTPTGNATSWDRDRAARVTKHMTWQILDQLPNYKQDKDAMLLAMAIRGSMFTKTYRDPITNMAKVDNVRPTDLVLPYGNGQRALADLPRMTQVVWVPKFRASQLTQQGYYQSLPEEYEDEKFTSVVDTTLDEILGFDNPGETVRDYCLVLEQHRYLELQPGKGLVPVIVWVDPCGERVLRLTIRYETDDSGNPIDLTPTQYFTHYTFLPNPDGVYGLGYGILLGNMNKAINRILRVIVDAGILATVGNMSGFFTGNLAGPKGALEFELGKFKKVAASSNQEIAKSIWSPSFPGPQPVLADLMKHLTLRGDRLGLVTELITGQAERVMQPTTVMALIEQSNVSFSAIYERIMTSWEHELGQLYHHNEKFMDDQEYFSVMDSGGQPDVAQILAMDYGRDMQIKPVINRAATEKERLTQSELEYQTMMTQPWLMFMPEALHSVLRRRLQSIGVEQIEEILPDPASIGQAMMFMMLLQSGGDQKQEGDKSDGKKTSNKK